jgi:hypothetical protein
MATLLTINDLNKSAFTSAIKPQITNITPTNFVFNNPTGFSTISANTPGYIIITGSNFTTNTQVFTKLIGTSVSTQAKLATSIAFISSSQLNVSLQASAAGNALLYVVNSYGTLGIKQITFA